MAEKKISQLTAKGATVADTDLLVVSEDAGGGAYTTKSVTGANIKGLVTDANLTTTDITTNDVSTSKHGFAPKAPNDTTKFLRGDGTWAVPSSGGLTKFTEAENTSAPNGTVYVDSLTAAASSTNADIAIVPKGTGAFMLDIPDNTSTGGNKRGANAVDLQTLRSSASQVASGTGSFTVGDGNTSSGNGSATLGWSNSATSSASFARGYGSTASSSYSAANGYFSTASGQSSFAAGQSVVASGGYSAAFGESCSSSGDNSFSAGNNSTANATSSFAFGWYARVFGIQNRIVFGRTQLTAGDCQQSKFFLSKNTTNNTATTLTTGGGVAGTTNQVILSDQSAYRFKGTIIGKKSGTTDIASWDVDGLIVRGANAASTTLAVSNVTLVQNTPAWGTPTLAADTTNGGLQVQVTGAAATNIQWTAVIETTEVIYA